MTEPKRRSTALISAGKNEKVLDATGYTPGDSLQLLGLNSTHSPLALACLCCLNIIEWTSVMSSKAKHELWKSFSLSVSLAPPHTNIHVYLLKLLAVVGFMFRSFFLFLIRTLFIYVLFCAW